MANMCNFVMRVKGSKKNIESFRLALEQKGSEWMGRGAWVNSSKTLVSNSNYAVVELTGEVKWSIEAALVLNAISMRTEPEKWYCPSGKVTDFTYITLPEACEKYEIEMELFSVEPGCEFIEHIVYKKDDEGDVNYVCDVYSYEEIWEGDEDTDEWECVDVIHDCPYYNVENKEWSFTMLDDAEDK